VVFFIYTIENVSILYFSVLQESYLFNRLTHKFAFDSISIQQTHLILQVNTIIWYTKHMAEYKTPENLTREETLSMISHELRTSLTASKWMLEMLQDGDVGELSPTQKEMINKLTTSNARMMDVATNLIMLSRASSEESRYNMESIDIVNVIDSVVFEFGSEAFSQHIEMIYVKPTGDFPKVFGDESKLRIVFQNLIDNAIKYSKEGDRVVVSLSQKEDMVIVTVKDTGIGIADKDLPLVMSQFYRAPNAAKKAQAGSGIGLYICARIVEGHKGKIDIDSSLEHGSAISVYLPTFTGQSSL